MIFSPIFSSFNGSAPVRYYYTNQTFVKQWNQKQHWLIQLPAECADYFYAGAVCLSVMKKGMGSPQKTELLSLSRYQTKQKSRGNPEGSPRKIVMRKSAQR